MDTVGVEGEPGNVTSRDVLAFFAHTEDRPVRVRVNGGLVPAATMFFYEPLDCYIIGLDTDSAEYRVAVGEAGRGES